MSNEVSKIALCKFLVYSLIRLPYNHKYFTFQLTINLPDPKMAFYPSISLTGQEPTENLEVCFQV